MLDPLRWRVGRPERTVLLAAMLGLAAIALLLAVVPRGLAQQILGAVVPSSSNDGGVVRGALLARHHVVFGSVALALLAAAVVAPAFFEALRRFLDWFVRLDRRVLLLGIIGVVVLSRAALVGRMLPIVPGQDTGHYWQLANTLLDEGRFIEYASHPNEPDGFRAWRLPGYPAALSVALLLTGRQPWSLVLLNTVWMVVLVLSVYGLVRALASEGAARLAAFGCAVYPTLVTASLRAMNELQFAALLALTAYLLFGGAPSLRRVALGGVALALAALTRGNGLLMLLALLPAYPLYLRWRSRPAGVGPWTWRALGLRAVVLALGFALTISPWTIRNRVVLGDWVPLATSGGFNMWLGHHPGSTGLHTRSTSPPVPEDAGELERSSYGARESLKYWLSDPLANMRIGVRIVVEILKVDEGAMKVISWDDGRSDGEQRRLAMYVVVLALFNALYYGLWGLIAVWALARVARSWPGEYRAEVPVFLALLYVATYIPFIGWQRYKIPALPFLIAAAAIVLAALATPTVGSSTTSRLRGRPPARIES